MKRAAVLAFAAGTMATPAMAQQVAQPAAGDEVPVASETPGSLVGRNARIELKREMTSRGAPEESTKTSLRFERFLSGPVTLLRLDIPLPDAETDFNGDPFQPHLGDLKARVGFRTLRRADLSFLPFVEATFPTADPKTLGTGKYQLGIGVRIRDRVTLPFVDASAHRTLFETQVQQVASVAGDPDRKDINATKLEFSLYDIWRERYTTKLKLKPNIDWVQDGKTGAVGEVEGGLFFTRDWRAWLMLGHRLWGPEGIQGTYTTKVELGVARLF